MTPPIDELCQALVAELARDPQGKRIVPMLQRYAREHDDWREFARFDDERYTRNLVHRCGEYELLLLCWGRGQVSPIHNHAGQHCWMAVLDGELEEVHFRQDGRGGLVEGRTQGFDSGGVAYIADDIALHRIQPRGGPGVSLHLYAKPIDTCEVYDPRTGRPSVVQMGYYSVRGERCTRPAEAVRADYL